MGHDGRVSDRHMDRLKLLGFVNCNLMEFAWPMGGDWPETERDKQIGQLTRQNFENLMGRAGSKILLATHGMPQSIAEGIVNNALEDISTNGSSNRYFIDL